MNKEKGGEIMSNYYIKTRSYEVFASKAMKNILDRNCDYRRYCWNQALALWNDLYSAHQIYDKICYTTFTPKKNKRSNKLKIIQKDVHLNPSPNWRLVRDRLVEEKEDWQFAYSAHLLQLTVQDLGKAWKSFFDKAQPDWGKPHFKSKRAPRQGFKSDQAKLIDGRLFLEKPQGLKKDWEPLILSEKPMNYPTGVMSFYRENGRYFVSIPYKIPKQKIDRKADTGKATGVDLNVGHFNYLGGNKSILPKKLEQTYEKIKHYQRLLARKREVNGKEQAMQSKKYLKTKTKLQAAYQRASNIQNDLMQKFTTMLVDNYDSIVIEDLDVKKMMMSHVASKGMHRSMFGKFRQVLSYKCEWYGKKLIVANKLYPSTQRCAVCGLVKKGDEKVTLYGNKKRGTKHNEFICYNPACSNYNKKIDRDENAMLNLTILIKHPELNRAL